MSIAIEDAEQEHQGRAGRIAAWLLAVIVATAATVLVSAAPASAAPTACSTGALLGDRVAVDTIEADAQQDFLRRLNDLRRARGLGALAWNGSIATPSIGWSQTMSAQDWLHHARDVDGWGGADGVEPDQDYVAINSRIVSNWQRLAENVGVSSMYSSCTMDDLEANAAKAVLGLHNAFVNSSGHFANMVGDHNQVGIGVHIDHAKMWVTVRFAKGDLPAGSSAAPLTTETYDADGGSGTIYRLYRAYFLREPERAGYDYWLGVFRQGYRLDAISNDFARSKEFQDRYGNVSNGEFLQRVYLNVMGRTADAKGYAYWMDQMNRGMSRGFVMIYFSDSAEFRSKTAAGRPPGY